MCLRRPDISDNDFQKKLKDLAKQYSAIGHVPFKEKDKVYKEYHEAIDAKRQSRNERLRSKNSLRKLTWHLEMWIIEKQINVRAMCT